MEQSLSCPDSKIFHKIEKYLERISLEAHARNIPLQAFNSTELRAHFEYESFNSGRIINSLEVLLEALTGESKSGSIVGEGRVLSANKELACLQRAIWKYGLRAKYELSDYISEGDVIEVYTAENVQIYRNLAFFNLCSYSLMDVMTKEWYELYERPEFVTELLIKQIGELLQSGEPFYPKIPVHLMTEKVSKEKRAFTTSFKYFLPLHDLKGDCTAFIVVIRAELHSQESVTAENRPL